VPPPIEPGDPTVRAPTSAPSPPHPPDPAPEPIPPVLSGEKRYGLEGFEERTRITEDGQGLQYLLYTPATLEPGKRYPALLFFHSASSSGADTESQYLANRKAGLELWASEQVQSRYPCFIIAPRHDRSVASTWVRKWRSTPDPAPDQREPLELAVELLRDELAATLPIDRRRLYVSGYSMGAFATWIAISRHPTLFAAALPLAGGGDPSHVVESDTAVWAFHGGADRAVPASRSRAMVEALRDAGQDVRYTELPGVGHSLLEEAFETPGVVEWMFQQRR